MSILATMAVIASCGTAALMAALAAFRAPAPLAVTVRARRRPR